MVSSLDFILLFKSTNFNCNIALRRVTKLNWLNNLNVAKKLSLIILIMLIAIIGIGATGYHFLNQSNRTIEKMYNEKVIALELISENRVLARRIETYILELMLNKNSAENKQLLANIDKTAKAFNDNFNKFELLATSDIDKQELVQLRQALSQYRQSRSSIIQLASLNKNAEAYSKYTQETAPLAETFSGKLISIGEKTKISVAALAKQNHNNFIFATTVFAVVIVSSLILILLLSFLIAKRITTRLNDVVNFVNQIATGDFSQTVPMKSLNDKSEFGILSQAIQTMQQNIKALIQQLSASAEQLAAASEELTATSEQSAQAAAQTATSITFVATGAEKQLSLTTKAASLIAQIATAIKLVTTNTSAVFNSAEQAAITADTGENSIVAAVTQMTTIEEKTKATATVIAELEGRSRQIGEIVETISNIASQTNLLALNAAIEAARAGEAGRGFVVVADEVRKLAEQSQESTKKITTLISDIQTQTNTAVLFMNDGKQEVDAGISLVSSAGQSFNGILKMVHDMSDEIHEILSAVEKITANTENIITSINLVEQESKSSAEQTQTVSAATEEQSAAVAEISATSQHLAQMAENLQLAIRKFKV